MPQVASDPDSVLRKRRVHTVRVGPRHARSNICGGADSDSTGDPPQGYRHRSAKTGGHARTALEPGEPCAAVAELSFGVRPECG